MLDFIASLKVAKGKYEKNVNFDVQSMYIIHYIPGSKVERERERERERGRDRVMKVAIGERETFNQFLKFFKQYFMQSNS